MTDDQPQEDERTGGGVDGPPGPWISPEKLAHELDLESRTGGDVLAELERLDAVGLIDIRRDEDGDIAQVRLNNYADELAGDRADDTDTDPDRRDWPAWPLERLMEQRDRPGDEDDEDDEDTQEETDR